MLVPGCRSLPLESPVTSVTPTRFQPEATAMDGGIDEALRDGIGRRTEEVIQDISSDIQRLWSTLHPNEQITDIRLIIPADADKAIDIALTFHGKPQPSPRNTLSDGHRNSLGLCIFLALLLREGRQDWPVFLDDVVSSFDRDHRGLLVDILTQDFSDRQVVLFTHDREWFAELRRRLPQAQWRFVRLGIWQDPESGLQVIDAADTFDEALEWINANPEFASTKARAVMDRELAAAAERLRLPMPFLSGDRNDHREAAKFLERLMSEAPRRLKRREGDTWVEADGPVACWRETHGLLITWANRDTHGGVGAIDESRRLIESCRGSLDALYCPGECKRPVWQRNDEQHEVLYCACGETKWKYG